MKCRRRWCSVCVFYAFLFLTFQLLHLLQVFYGVGIHHLRWLYLGVPLRVLMAVVAPHTKLLWNIQVSGAGEFVCLVCCGFIVSNWKYNFCWVSFQLRSSLPVRKKCKKSVVVRFVVVKASRKWCLFNDNWVAPRLIYNELFKLNRVIKIWWHNDIYPLRSLSFLGRRSRHTEAVLTINLRVDG